MYKLYSITTSQAAIIALFRVINRYESVDLLGDAVPSKLPGVRHAQGDHMPEYPRIIAVREGSGRTSVWNEYLCLSLSVPGKAAVQVCRYEALAEYERPEDGENQTPLPTEIDGKTVVGVEDGYIVGGELVCCDDQEIVYGLAEIDDVVERLKDYQFHVDATIVEQLKSAVNNIEDQMKQHKPSSETKPQWMSEEAWLDHLEEVKAFERRNYRLSGGRLGDSAQNPHPQTSSRGGKSTNTEPRRPHLVYGFLTTAPNAVVEPIHQRPCR